MKTLRIVLGLVIGIGAWAGLRADEAKTAGVVGTWEGTLDVGLAKLRLAFRVTEGKDGALTTLMDSLDQGAKGIAVSATKVEEKSVTFEVKAIRGSYLGMLDDAGATIKGEWSQGGRKFPLELTRVEKPTEIARPQMPREPFPYAVHEVTFPSDEEKVTLAGSLTVPPGDGPFPAVLLITGSGPQDRDESLAGHKPFLVLADDLTRAGIVVLRVDDRGAGKSTGDAKAVTIQSNAVDVLAGLEFLKSRPEVDAKKLGLIGHSEGGLLAPLVATRSQDVEFIVSLAGTAMTGEEILVRQGKLILEAMGADKAAVERQGKLQSELFQAIRSRPDAKEMGEALAGVLKAAHEALTDDEKNAVGDVDAFVKSQSAALLSPWMLEFLVHDPRTSLAKVTCPVLALNGEKDLQVPTENIDEMRKALEAGGNTKVTTKVFPGLNHLFQHCTTGAPSEYSTIEETMAPEVLATIRDWIKAQAGK